MLGRLEAGIARERRFVADEVGRLTRLAEDLLVLARVDEGELPLRREPLAVAELLESVARRFSPGASEAGRSVEVAETEGLSLVGDRLRLEQALGNLVDNALRHGGGTVRIQAARRDGTVELSVSDEGEGFPPDFVSAHSTASRAPTRPAAAARPVSGSRSSPRSRRLSAGPSRPRIATGRARSSRFGFPWRSRSLRVREIDCRPHGLATRTRTGARLRR